MRNVNVRGNYVYMLHDIIYVACQHKNQTCIVGSTVKWLKYWIYGVKHLPINQ